MKTTKKKSKTGQLGEQIAANYIENKGFEILERNWRKNHKEIDIISKKEDVLIIIEVKTRTQEFVDPPGEVVTKKKQRNIIAASNDYIFEKDLDLQVRFDVISVTILDDKHSIEHIAEAFYPMV
jgi:putative endonuclease